MRSFLRRATISRLHWREVKGEYNVSALLRRLPAEGRLAYWPLYQLARGDARLRARIARVVATVPLPLPHFWLAALVSLGDAVDFEAALPDYYAATST